ncbi:MAG TPA: flavodoxin domain-containing protein, partial [Phnomibacter sp.]|nr:flavodoxin domain-containing protein [Phnomibacter sp.]
MLAEAKLATLHSLIEKSSGDELLWMSGYLAGLAAKNITAPPAPERPTPITPPAIDTITIVYGTETGNARKAATMATNALKRAGIRTRLVPSENYKPELLEKETFLVLVISTQGEGEPPATARALLDHLTQRTAPLPQLQYGILALGSRSYPLFCQAGIDADTQLKRLQATAVVPMGTCDDDYEPDAETWIAQLVNYLQNPMTPTAPMQVVKRPAEGKKFFT